MLHIIYSEHMNRIHMQLGQYMIKIRLKPYTILLIFCFVKFVTDMANLNKSPKVDAETMR